MHRPLLLAALLTMMGCSSPASDSATSGADLEGTTNLEANPNAAAAVTITVEPSDKGQVLVDAINAATTSIHVTMYILTAPTVINALIARHAAGVEVEVILNKNGAFAAADASAEGDDGSAVPDANDITPDTSNTTTFTQLTNAGISVVWSSSAYRYTHEKCIIIDGMTAWIMTMNSAVSSFTSNREYLAADTLTADVKEAEAIFEADFAAKPITPAGNLLVSPVSMRDGIVTLLGKATKTVDFEVEELGDAAITTAFCSAAKAGATVRGVVADITESSVESKAITTLKACGVDMRTLKKPYIHAKAIVVDGDDMYVGSANFSSVSLSQNRELGLVSTTASTIKPVATTLAADIAASTAL
jgi:cardiolipin synthase